MVRREKPLPEDFDAITQTHEGDNARGGRRVNGNRLQGTSVFLTDGREPDLILVDSTQMGMPVPRRRNSASFSERHYGLDPTRELPAADREYEQYMDEMDQMFGGRRDVQVRVKRLENHTSRGARRGSSSSTRQAPHAGQEYEVVRNRVLETGPERTVTISTWRERVAQEAPREVEMSVYYVSAEDYTEEYDHKGKERQTSTPWPTSSREVKRYNYSLDRLLTVDRRRSVRRRFWLRYQRVRDPDEQDLTARQFPRFFLACHGLRRQCESDRHRTL